MLSGKPKNPAERPPRILVVDDDRRVVELLDLALSAHGFQVLTANDGEEALRQALDERPDLVVLDVRLPRKGGLDVCEAIRRDPEDGGVPIILVSASAETETRIQGFARGADDYMGKPFRIEELLARLRALIRRASGQATPELRCGPVTLDPRVAKVTLNGVPVKLTSHEFRVLSYLMHHRGKVVSQSELTDHIYAQGFDRDSNTVEVFIARLRRKLGPTFIETVRGLGYRVQAA